MMSVFLTTYQGAILGPIARLLGYILQGIYSVLSTVGIENTGITGEQSNWETVISK